MFYCYYVSVLINKHKYKLSRQNKNNLATQIKIAYRNNSNNLIRHVTNCLDK